MVRHRGTRPLWLWVLLDAVLLTVVALNIRAAVFCARVGGSLGRMTTIAALAVVVISLSLAAASLSRLFSTARKGSTRSD